MGDIEEFSIKCHAIAEDLIGIMSNTSIIEESYEHYAYADAQFYYYHLDGELYQTDKVGGGCEIIFNNDEIESVYCDDIVTVRINCIEWTLTFLLNDEIMGGIINIKPNETYYPFIGLDWCEGEYELLR